MLFSEAAIAAERYNNNITTDRNNSRMYIRKTIYEFIITYKYYM